MASETNCSNCNQASGPDDMFCENCGYDFLTGSLPPDLEGVPAGAASVGEAEPESSETPTSDDADPDDDESEQGENSEGSDGEQSTDHSGVVERIRVEVAVDRTFFEQVVTGGEIDFPSDPVSTQVLEVAGDEIHIGRASSSRAIHPDIDIAELTNDQAVSSRHAVIRVAGQGEFQLIDVGSTNGTFLELPSSDAIGQGEPLELAYDVPFFVGAWTRLTILDDE